MQTGLTGVRTILSLSNSKWNFIGLTSWGFSKQIILVDTSG